MKTLDLKLWLLLLAAISAASTTAGTGSGSVASGGDHVTFSWNSTGPTSGTMSARTSDGKSFSGQCFEITDGIGPVWNDASTDAPYPEDASTADVATHYLGRVVADLRAPDGARMRCSFDLTLPREGMSSGGSGLCQMPDGSTIVATFPAT